MTVGAIRLSGARRAKEGARRRAKKLTTERDASSPSVVYFATR